MNSSEVRKTFLDFFKEKNHELIKSSPLIPQNDSTLLFTNAGMIQFKDVFLGAEKTPFKRATSSQKCIRAGGKHNDLENVGYTLRHHTFFEMLGNFSFGDYFKEDAIKFAWELLTERYELPQEKLWITVHIDDDESEDIWLNKIGVPKERVNRLDEDNFWSMGDTGPCGPCSEIFYDHGSDFLGDPPAEGNESGDRYIEIYNLVFMQFDRDANGNMTPLPKPSVDTGMGFERITAVMQNTNDNYKTDIFDNLIKTIAKKLKVNDISDPSLRVIADHLRSSSFLLSDGVIIGNEGRSYVLRRIIRRALRHAYKLNTEENHILSKSANELIDNLGSAYPELIKNKNLIKDSLENEENQFSNTLRTGMSLLEEKLNSLKEKIIPGELAFKLYDTYGFPLDMTLDLAREKDLEVDVDEYENLMDNQRKRAKESSSFESLLPSSIDLDKETNFLGYQQDVCEAQIKLIFKNGLEVEEVDSGECLFITDKTPFYAESGGQIGDSGFIKADIGLAKVKDTQKTGGYFIHFAEVEKGSFKKSQNVLMEIETDKRKKIVSNHSATHLMHAALRNILGKHVEQKGSLVNEEKLRFDFSHDKALTKKEIIEIENQVNEIIRKDIKTEVFESTYDEAIKLGALAFFGEKYGDTVRVLKIGGDFSTELCGGTHVKSTSEIKLFKIVSESSISSGVRRIEAVSNSLAEELVGKLKNEIIELSKFLGTEVDNIPNKIKDLGIRLKKFQERFKKIEQKQNENLILSFKEDFKKVNEMNVLVKRIDGINLSSLRGPLDSLKNSTGRAVIVLSGEFQSKAMIIASISKDLLDEIDARNLLKSCSKLLDAKGGGKEDFAQAGGGDPKKIDLALIEANNFLN
ncbi:MAG: alanine--tRNA ligase [Gammaproteobacteria bacterium]